MELCGTNPDILVTRFRQLLRQEIQTLFWPRATHLRVSAPDISPCRSSRLTHYWEMFVYTPSLYIYTGSRWLWLATGQYCHLAHRRRGNSPQVIFALRTLPATARVTFRIWLPGRALTGSTASWRGTGAGGGGGSRRCQLAHPFATCVNWVHWNPLTPSTYSLTIECNFVSLFYIAYLKTIFKTKPPKKQSNFLPGLQWTGNNHGKPIHTFFYLKHQIYNSRLCWYCSNNKFFLMLLLLFLRS